MDKLREIGASQQPKRWNQCPAQSISPNRSYATAIILSFSKGTYDSHGSPGHHCLLTANTRPHLYTTPRLLPSSRHRNHRPPLLRDIVLSGRERCRPWLLEMSLPELDDIALDVRRRLPMPSDSRAVL